MLRETFVNTRRQKATSDCQHAIPSTRYNPSHPTSRHSSCSICTHMVLLRQLVLQCCSNCAARVKASNVLYHISCEYCDICLAGRITWLPGTVRCSVLACNTISCSFYSLTGRFRYYVGWRKSLQLHQQQQQQQHQVPIDLSNLPFRRARKIDATNL